MFSASALQSCSRRVVAQLQQRLYITRAHPKPKPVFPITTAIQMVLEEVEQRKIKRALKWERNTEQRAKQGKIKDDGPYRNQNETIEIALNLNLDPRKPGQALRGAITLPHGTGKVVGCVVFCADPLICNEALKAGALHAGGETLVEQIAAGTIPLDFSRTLASQDILPFLTKKLARTLGPKGLMPNAKVGTLVQKPDQLLEALKKQIEGQLQYRTEKAGVVHLAVGKGSFGYDKLIDNIRTALEEIYQVKPELYGKGKKASKNASYFLSAYATASQGKGIKLDLRTVDPTSAFFCTEVLEK